MKNVIYQIRNTVTGIRYIGSAHDSVAREYEHFRLLGNNNHFNPHLQSSYNKHGKEKFVFEIIHRVDHRKNLYKVENMYIKSYDFDLELYNKCPDARSTLGMSHTEETKELLRQINLGKTVSEETREKIRIANIGRKLSPETIELVRQASIGRTHSEETKRKRKETLYEKYGKWPNCRSVAQIDPKTGDIIKIHTSIKSAAQEIGINYSGISSVCHKRKRHRKHNNTYYVQKHAGGFSWKFVEDL